MARTPTFLADPADTRESIMRATYLALCEYGYADLTIQRIADHFPKSKSLLYHHYDGKDDLLLDFLSFMLDRYESRIPGDGTDDPAAALRAIIDRVLAPRIEDEYRDFARAMIELRAQAGHDEDYREHFTRSDRVFRERTADIIRSGVENDEFRDVDPDRTAALLHTLIVGTMTRRSTSDDDVIPLVRAEIDDLLDRRLFH